MAIGKSRPEKCQRGYFQKVEKWQKKQHFFSKFCDIFWRIYYFSLSKKRYAQAIILKLYYLTITRCNLWYSNGGFLSKIIRNVDCEMDVLY